MANYTVEAIILKRTDFGEKDRLLTLLTPNQGKLRAIAKGVRRPGSKMAGHLELFSHSKIFLAEGRNLDIITQVQLISTYQVIASDLALISWAYYVAELVDKLIGEREENYSLFRLFKSTLTSLDQSSKPELVLSNFEMQLLSLLGYEPDLACCSRCQSELAGGSVSLNPVSPGLLCSNCVHEKTGLNLSKSSVLALQSLQKQDAKGFSEDLDWDEVRFVLTQFLQQITERKMKSSDFIANIQKFDS